MVMQSMRTGKFSGIIKLAFMALLVLAAAGLVLTDVGGFFRGGVSGNDVAKIDDQTISIQEFDRTVRRILPRLGISPQEAYQFGFLEQLLNEQINNHILQLSAQNAGIEVSREIVAQQVQEMLEPLVQEGQSKQEVLDQILLTQGMTEGQFVNQIKNQSATSLLITALQGGLARPSNAMLRDLYLHANEKRSVEIIVFPHKDYNLSARPDDEDIRSTYEQMKESYAVPEKRSFKIIKLDEAGLRKTIDITEEELHQIYESEIESFKIPETRTLEQAILKDQTTAGNVLEKIKAGTSLKQAVKDATGDESAYLGETDFEKAGTLEEIRKVAFANQKTGEALGPVKTALGWHVLIVRDIKPERTKPFESVKGQLKENQLELELLDQKFELSTILDDLLASGASLEEIRKTVDVKIEDVKNSPRTGRTPGGKDMLKSYEEDRTILLETAFDLFEDESSPVIELSDGSFVAIKLEKTTPKTYPPLEEIEDEINTQWTRREKTEQNRIYVNNLLQDIESGESDFSAIAAREKKPVKHLENLKRQDNPPAPLIAATLPEIFAQELKAPFMLDVQNGNALLRVTDVILPENIPAEELKDLRHDIKSQEQQETLSLYIAEKRQDYSVSVNKRILRQAYGPTSTDVDYEEQPGGIF